MSGGSINIICGSVIFDKEPAIQNMSDAVNELFRINDALRTRIFYENGVASQCIEDYQKKSFEVVFFSDKEQVHRYAQEQAQIPLDLNKNLCEIKIIASTHFSGILYRLHHIIADAWTLSLLATQFNRIINNEEVSAYSYRDHIIVEEQYLSGKRYLKDKEFYRKQFNKQPNPVMFSETSINNINAKRMSFAFDFKTSDLLKKFSEMNGISTATFFLSVISTYYNRKLNGAESFYIGLPVVNRTGPIEKNTAGLFINNAPVLIELDNNLSFLQNAICIEESVTATIRHQKYPYEHMLTDLNNNFGFKGKLFDVIFSYQNAQISGDSFESTWYHNGMQSESLQIHIDDRDNTGILKIHYDYQIEKFSEKDIEKLHEHISNLIFSSIENCDKSLLDLKMLSNEENNKLLYEYNDTAHTYSVPESSTIYSLFEKAAKQNPDKICIKIAEKTITFRELINFSEKLDTKIRGMTECKKSIVAVIAERSVEMYVGIYGIIRGGNAYLPIDPGYPEERINYMLENSDAAVVVVQEKFAHLVKKTRCINITEFINKFNEEDSIIPDCAAKADDTAYVIYTSGSTGNPKGTKVSHKSAINRILWMQDKYPLKDNGVILQKTPYTFDVSVWELFWWGMCGGKLSVSRPGEHFLPAKILDETYSNKVTHLHFVPSVFKLFLNYLEEYKDELYKFNSVRYVFLSGEVLTASLIERFYKLYDYNKVTLHNLYGPTECAVDVTYYDCAPDDADPVPIGKPIYNTQMYVVDRYMNVTPNGVEGELCIAGANVGQGYLNNPDLTAEKFIDNPFGEGKLYKTGDLAYWRNDGQIIFCGRMDGQIKLNGQRIEIGEIESVISCIDCIDSAAVIIKNVNERDMLVAFYTGKEGSESIIKETCSVKLPKYMVPSIVVHLDKLPLNHSGKLDRKILSQIETEFKRNDENESPINELERFICETFEKILCRQNISRNSDFFDIGGTSLSMISLLSEKGFEDITAAEFMRNPTPAGLALVMNDKKIIKLKYLEPLYLADKTKQVLILLPFAGGGVEAYGNFVNSLKNINENTSVYFIRYLHSTDECRRAADEISNTIKNTEIILYSHCVGSAVALQILNFLEKTEISVKHYFAGASIPPAKPTKKNIWNIVPDKALKSILMKSGAKLNELSDEKISELFRQFRKDTDFANISFYEFNTKIKVPVTVIISKKDIFTLNYRQAEKLWGNFAEVINEVRFIDSESHYFQSENSQALANILNNPRFIH